jgi:murein peptide amidase A
MRRHSGVLFLLLVVWAASLVVPNSAQARTDNTTSASLGMRIIGYSVKGRPIRAWHLGDPTSPVKAVFIATMHGNEPQPAQILFNLRDGAPIHGADIWVIPYLNPDGHARNTRKNAHGVDLNRNFPVRWIRQGGAYNSGPRPASEPETRAIMRFLRRINPRFVVSFHQPLYGVDMSSPPKVHPLALRLVQYLGLPAKQFRCDGVCHGTMTQWFNKQLPGRAITVEYGRQMTWRQENVTGPTGLLKSVFASR